MMNVLSKKLLFGYDTHTFQGKMIGAFGFMYIGNFCLIKDINEKEKYHFAVKVEWRCSFVSVPDVQTYYGELKERYDISAGKFLQIELMEFMKSLAKDRKKLREYLTDFSSENEDIEEKMKEFSEEKMKNVSNITVISCSVPSSLPLHIKNGARIIEKNEIEKYEGIEHVSIDCPGMNIIYWTLSLDI
jgi:hypothetical protein